MTHLQTHLQHTSTTSAAIVQRIFNSISRASKLLQVRSYLETPYSWIVNLYKYLDKLLQQHVHVIKLAQKHHAILPHHFTSLSLCSLLYLISLSWELAGEFNIIALASLCTCLYELLVDKRSDRIVRAPHTGSEKNTKRSLTRGMKKKFSEKRNLVNNIPLSQTTWMSFDLNFVFD